MAPVPVSAIPLPPGDEYYDLAHMLAKSPPRTRPRRSGSTAAWSGATPSIKLRAIDASNRPYPTIPSAPWPTGLAYATGLNYNKGWGFFDPIDLKHTMKACHDASWHAPRLIEIESVRYPMDHPVADFAQINHSYDQAMRKVHEELPKDLDVMTLYVDSKMHIAQRKMFDSKTGLPIEMLPVFDVQRLFQEGLRHLNANTNSGILHFCIHFWEMSATPAVALPPADHLRTLVPDAGHLHHMPTHLDVLVGDYRRGIESNTAAVAADEKYLARYGAKNMYSFYRLHNYHSLIYSAMLSDQSKIALATPDQMEASITTDVLLTKSPPLADWLEFFLSARVRVYVRFGLWGALNALLTPEEQRIAHAARGNLPEAYRYRELYKAAAANVPASRRDHPNCVVDILKVATAMLNGEIEYRAGNYDVAFRCPVAD